MSGADPTPAVAAALLADATGRAVGDDPPPRGTDWFRELEPHRTLALLAADVVEAARRGDTEIVDDVLRRAAWVLAHTERDSTIEAVEIALLESLVCTCSHDDDLDVEALVGDAPSMIGAIVERRVARLEQIAARHIEVRPRRIAALDDPDPVRRRLARATTYAAVDATLVSIGDLVSSDAPTPWPLRHPVAFGCCFGAVLLVLFLVALATG